MGTPPRGAIAGAGHGMSVPGSPCVGDGRGSEWVWGMVAKHTSARTTPRGARVTQGGLLGSSEEHTATLRAPGICPRLTLAPQPQLSANAAAN